MSRLEVHEHVYVSGPQRGKCIHHSHGDGDRGHKHPETGPACYTIDRDEWRRATGLVGGGRKKFTKAPTGPQLPCVELETWQREFTVTFVDHGHTPAHAAAGISAEHLDLQRKAFLALAAQPPAVALMMLGADMTPIYEYHDLREQAAQGTQDGSARPESLQHATGQAGEATGEGQ